MNNKKERSKPLTIEQKLELMKEYINTTGEKITLGTVYKGRNLGSIMNNLRRTYWQKGNSLGEKYNDLVQEFKDLGIIIDERERRRTSQQEQYVFLMKNVGNKNATMRNGVDYEECRYRMQHLYNAGKCKLTYEQIEALKKEGILHSTASQRQQIAEKHNLPISHLITIENKFGSVSEFVKRYKTGDVDYRFPKDVFCGFRGIVLSENDITEEEKLAYAKLVKKVHQEDLPIISYIDIDKLEETMKDLTDDERKTIKTYFGIGEEALNLREIAEKYKCSATRAGQIMDAGIKKLRFPKRKHQFFGNVEKDKEELKGLDELIEKSQNNIKNINIIKEYLLDENGEPKKNIEDVELSKLGILGLDLGQYSERILTIKDLIHEETRRYHFKNKNLDINLKDLNLSARAFNCLTGRGIENVEGIVSMSEEELRQIRSLGNKTAREIIDKVASLGLLLKDENDMETTEKDEDQEKEGIRRLVERANKQLETYNEKVARKQKLTGIICRYELAYKNYMEDENVFDPKSIVPAIPKIKEEKKEDERTQLLRRIKEKQAELQRLQKQLEGLSHN